VVMVGVAGKLVKQRGLQNETAGEKSCLKQQRT
jgi:hypothetical protein